MKPLIDNPSGIGLVAMFHHQMLLEQAEMVLEFQSKDLKDLPSRTPEQKLEMAWDEELM